MRIFAVDKNNDLYIGPNGQLAMNADLAAFSQACEHAMQSLLGEMVFATGRGLPYMETVWGSSPNLRLFEDHARRILRGIPGSLGVTAFECENTDNTLTYRASIRSVYGTAAINGEGADNG